MKKINFALFPIVLLFLVLASCTTKKKEVPYLISWSSEFVDFADNDAQYNYSHDQGNFIKDYFSVNYFEDSLVATTLISLHCVDQFLGAIEVKNDTIYLKANIVTTEEPYCPEFHQFRYVIANPENKPYVIISVR